MRKDYAIGVDLGATNVRIGLGDEEGSILYENTERTEKRAGPEAICGQIIRMIFALREEIDFKRVKGVGIGSIGPLDPDKGAVVNSPNMPYEFISIVEPIKRRLNIPIYLLNDCTAAVIGEKEFGVGRQVDNLAYVSLSTGIGGGAYVDDNLLLGKNRNSVEIGHFTVDFDGELICGCGRRGHWEAYCSGKNIPNYVRFEIEMLEKKRGDILMTPLKDKPIDITAEMLYDTARKGDILSLEIVEKIGNMNAVGFGNVIDAYDPSIISVGGAIALENPNLVMDPIEKHVGEHAINEKPKMMITPLGENVVLFGAIAMVFKPPF